MRLFNFFLGRRIRIGACLFRIESEAILAYSLYVDSTDVAKLLAALSASSPEIICIAEKINSETLNLWVFQRVRDGYWFCSDSLYIRWLEFAISDDWQLDILSHHIIESIAILHKRIMSGICDAEIQTHLSPFSTRE
jgi:hypothetical protein